ncbi:MAG: o-succinylbenzoate synthase [Flavobacteriales bacterium]|nr:o-succinylbenzoate synthase [Flavobacteriales bacterium]
MQLSYQPYTLKFKQPSGTSRGILKEKKIWIISAWDSELPDVVGTGECNPLVGLSVDDVPDYEEKLAHVCTDFSQYEENLYEYLIDFPSIYFGIEMALLDLKRGGKKVYFNTPLIKFKQPIKINGLIWMGSHEFMYQQIQQKLEAGFSCIKLKIGAIDFQQELRLLASIREKYNEEELELRVDANGAFSPEEALEKLEQLNEFGLHSIEQPIRAGQYKEMASLCRTTPFPIALDEELIGIKTIERKRALLEEIMPQYIILKPSLIGGFKGTMEWISVAGELGIPWWITSALESNIGLNAIAQFTSTLYNPLPQGLGTGQLYTNNIDSPLEINGEWLTYKV